MPITRRHLLQGMGGMAALSLTGLPTRSFAGDPDADPRLVVVTLRGAMDGLAAVPPIADPWYERARAGLALPPVGEEGGVLPLDGFFAMSPLLPKLHARYQAGELLVAHAVATPYRERSHFDAQNLLESGGTRPFAREDGWLGRALAARTTAPGAVALQPMLPLVLRGGTASSWSPTTLDAPDPRLVDQLAALYGERDPSLATALAGGREAAGWIEREAGAKDGSFASLATAAGAFLANPQGPRVAVLELGGWDSHNLQSLPYGTLHRALTDLDAGLDALRTRLGETIWKRTVVVAATEFGRTVAMNGSNGTDHGTASCAFVLGGAVAGGRVIADWPGLEAKSLYEGRDLQPTMDLRRLWKGALRDHLDIAPSALDTTVFPATPTLKPLDGVIRSA